MLNVENNDAYVVAMSLIGVLVAELAFSILRASLCRHVPECPRHPENDEAQGQEQNGDAGTRVSDAQETGSEARRPQDPRSSPRHFDIAMMIFVTLSFLDFVSDVLYVLTEDFHTKYLHALGLLFFITPYFGYSWILSKLLDPSRGNSTFEFGLFGTIDFIGEGVKGFWGGVSEFIVNPSRWDLIQHLIHFVLVVIPWAVLFYIYSWLWFFIVVLVGFLFFQCRLLALADMTKWMKVVPNAQGDSEYSGFNNKTFNVLFLSELFLEAIPQIAVQITNNVLIGSWDWVAVVSATLAGFMIMAGLHKIRGHTFISRESCLDIFHGHRSDGGNCPPASTNERSP